MAYEESDARFFFGRDSERDMIVDNLRASRLTVLYGTSGVGKSSVLQAGVAPRLRQLATEGRQIYGRPEFAVVTFSAWRDDPIAGLARSIREAVAEALGKKPAEALPQSRDVAALASAWSDSNGIELLIILDQFEEYFLYRGGEAGAGTFAHEFPRAANDRSLRARFLLSLRDDALSKLDRFRSQVPGLFDNMLRIKHLNGKAARLAIHQSVKTYNELFVAAGEQPYSVSDELVTEVIRQVRVTREVERDAGSGSPAGDSLPGDDLGDEVAVETSYLQLVMKRLWDRAEISRQLRLPDRREDVKDIVQDHVNTTLGKLPVAQQKATVRILDYLVTSSGSKIAYLKSDLVDKTELSEKQVGDVLEVLDEAKILRPVEPPLDRPREKRYEVFHDVLAQALQSWQSRAELAAAARKRYRRLGVIALAALLVVSVGLTILVWRAKVHATEIGRDLKVKNERNEELLAAEKELRAANDALVASLQETIKKLERAATQQLDQADDQQEQEDLDFQISQLAEERGEVAKAAAEDPGAAKPRSTMVRPVLSEKRLWKPDQPIRIGFLENGGPEPAVEWAIQEWTRHANLRFVRTSARDAQVRITWREPGSWSYVGTDALNVPWPQPTMSLQGIIDAKDISDDQRKRMLLGAFGHVLGFINEHQNPNANIRWNREALYRRFPYLTPDMVEREFFLKYEGPYREFDPQSVMMPFEITPDLLEEFDPALLDRPGRGLSEGDKRFAAELYPYPPTGN